NPAAIDGADPVLAALQGGGMVAIGGAFVAAAVSLVARYRRAGGPERGQLTFLGAVATGLLLTVVAGNLLTGGRIDDHAALSAATGLLLMAGLPAGIAAAILWRGLYDLDRWVRRSLVYGVLWLAITAVYVTVAWAVGLAAGDRLPIGLAVLLTVVVTLVFEPARRSLGRLADRRVFGPRPSGYELTAALGAAVDDTDDLGPLAQRLAELVGRGVDARQARVTLLGDDGEVVATYPDLPDATSTGDQPAPIALRVPLVHRDQPLGTVECGLKQDGSGYSDDDRRLLDLLAREAALAAHGLRLAASLAVQVETVGQQARELAASRSRIIAAQETERRRIERNIHDGAQQELVALIAKIRLARDQLDRDPAVVAATLTDAQHDVGRVLRDIRELAQGIHPTVLGDQGLVHATEDRTTRLPIDVRVHADATTRTTRYDDLIEGAAYFVVSEALANVLKHADADQAHVHIAQDNGHLHIEVTDNGHGFERTTTPARSGPVTGTGLLALADRLAALGGHLHIDSTPGQGTTLAARLPAKVIEEPASGR
ncbi:MAG: sensor histidine kinase, partial [Acidimicrobiales bacterium]